jgi:hypothetical protein
MKRVEEGKSTETMDRWVTPAVFYFYRRSNSSRYWAFKNSWSMDGLPGVQQGLITGRKENIAPIKKMVGPLAPTRYRTGYYHLHHVILIAVLSLLLGVFGTLYGPMMLEQTWWRPETMTPALVEKLEEFMTQYHFGK